MSVKPQIVFAGEPAHARANAKKKKSRRTSDGWRREGDHQLRAAEHMTHEEEENEPHTNVRHLVKYGESKNVAVVLAVAAVFSVQECAVSVTTQQLAGCVMIERSPNVSNERGGRKDTEEAVTSTSTSIANRE